MSDCKGFKDGRSQFGLDLWGTLNVQGSQLGFFKVYIKCHNALISISFHKNVLMQFLN